jgi:DNA-binding CsgD family transcriptional regulator
MPAEGIFLLVGAGFALATAVFASKSGVAAKRTHSLLFWATTALITLSVLLFGLSALLGGMRINPELSLVAFMISGAGAGGLQVLWGGRFAAHSTRFSALCAPAAAILTGLVIVLISGTTSILAIVLFPLASLAMLLANSRPQRIGKGLIWADEKPGDPSPDPAFPPQEISRRHYGRDIAKLMVSILVFSLLCRLYDTVPRMGDDPFEFFGGGTLAGVILDGVLFLMLVGATRGRLNVALAYRFSCPVMVTGLAILALFFEQYGAVSLLLINMGYELFDILSWILFAEISRRTSEPFKIFGLGTASAFIGMGLAYIAGPTFYNLLAVSGSPFPGFALLSIIVLVVLFFLVIPESTLLKLASSMRGVHGEASGEASQTKENTAAANIGGSALTLDQLIARRCEKVAACYALTAREREVLAFLARGRTLQIVSRDLQIAKGTARTHIENIYAKLGTHKQQELIDLVESFEE